MTYHEWFVVVQGTRRTDPMVENASPVTRHAKAMGTYATACGLPCSTWLKYWETAYVPDCPGESCPACDSVIRSRVGVQQIADWPHPR